MPELPVGAVVETDTPTFEVTSTPANPLPPGKMVFQLIVKDDNGNESLPTQMEVFVIDNQRPTAILQGPGKVPVGQSFTLDGRASTDIGGRVVKYRWTRLS